MDDGGQTTEHLDVCAPCGTMLRAVYTNEDHTLESALAMYEEWLEDEKHKVVGLDLEYTPPGKTQAVALVQIAMRKHVLLYHWCKSRQTPRARDLLQNFFSRKGITFASVDTTGDKKALAQSGFVVPPQYHFDIQMEFPEARIGMDILAGEIIHTSYHYMKVKFRPELHHRWDWKPLDPDSIDYAAVDGYVSYELYHRIRSMKDSLGLTWRNWLQPWCMNADGTSRRATKTKRSKRREVQVVY